MKKFKSNLLLPISIVIFTAVFALLIFGDAKASTWPADSTSILPISQNLPTGGYIHVLPYANGTIVVWIEQRSGASRACAQFITQAGDTLWSPSGHLLTPNHVVNKLIALKASDSTFYVFWNSADNQPGYVALYRKSDGTMVWPSPLSFGSDVYDFYVSFNTTSTGNAGVCWRESNWPATMKTNLVLYSGSIGWGNGLELDTGTWGPCPSAFDIDNNYVVSWNLAWTVGDAMYIKKLSVPGGATVWGPIEGFPGSGWQTNWGFAAYPDGGVVIIKGYGEVTAQRFDVNGNRMWNGTSGVYVASNGSWIQLRIAPNGNSVFTIHYLGTNIGVAALSPAGQIITNNPDAFEGTSWGGAPELILSSQFCLTDAGYRLPIGVSTDNTGMCRFFAQQVDESGNLRWLPGNGKQVAAIPVGTGGPLAIGAAPSVGQVFGIPCELAGSTYYKTGVKAIGLNGVIPPSIPMQPPVTITLTPLNPPIVIPASGGSFDFNALIHVTTMTPQTVSIWSGQYNPQMQWQGPLMGPVTLMLPGGATIGRIRTQNVSSTASPGVYIYRGYTGIYSSVKWDSSGFTYTKSATGDGPLMGNWDNFGESFEEWQTEVTPSEHVIATVSPNPFNPSSIIRYTLPSACQVNLEVYDVSGKFVTTLAQGIMEQGVHEAVFDGANLSSGIYLYSLRAGAYHQSGKLVLTK